jgi:hypothetical protein
VLKITGVESRSDRRLILEGKLLAPWVSELRTACEKARGNLQNRELVIDLKNLTAISQQGKDVLLELISESVKFRCGVFTKHVLRQLARRKKNRKEAEIEPARSSLRASTLSENYPKKFLTEFWPFQLFPNCPVSNCEHFGHHLNFS